MSDPWFKFDAADWITGTAALTAAERGIYITIVALIYDNDGPIKADPKRLARACGTSNSAFKKAFGELVESGKLTLTEDGLVTNLRAENEMQDRSLRREKARVAGEISQQKQRKRRTKAGAKPKPYKKENKDSPHTPRTGGLIEELNEKGVCLQARVQPASATHPPEGEDHSWWSGVRAELKAAHPDKARMINPLRLAKGRRLVVSSPFDLRPVLEAFGPELQTARAFSVLAEEGDEVVFTQIGQRGAA